MKLQTILMAVPCLWVSLAAAHAQITSGSESGTVLDAQGVVAAVKVTLTDQIQATTRSAAGGRSWAARTGADSSAPENARRETSLIEFLPLWKA